VGRALFARKPLERILQEGSEGRGGMKRSLGPWELLALGIGAIIGGGIFVLTGVAARDAGPSVILSFILAGLACAFAALCYSELASMIPVAGSAYVYAYASMGELFAWIIGWDLILEYSLAASMVASGWSKYAVGILQSAGIKLPVWLADDPWSVDGGFIDLPALLLVMAMTAIVVAGIQGSMRLTQALVLIKLTVIVAVVVVGSFYIDPSNWRPFMPSGVRGMLAAAALVFVAYLGFDAVSTTAEEARNPQKDLPRGILGSLIVCTILYAGVSLVLTGVVPYTRIDTGEPIAAAFQSLGLRVFSSLIAAGAVAGLTSVLAASLIAQPRVLLAMARDGLLPRWSARIHPRFGTPVYTTAGTGILVGLAAAFVPIEELARLESIGTLFAFILVCSAVLVLRRVLPDVRRGYTVPLVPLTPVLGIVICLGLMLSLPAMAWLRLFAWMGIGLVIYFFYGRKNSLNRGDEPRPATPATEA